MTPDQKAALLRAAVLNDIEANKQTHPQDRDEYKIQAALLRQLAEDKGPHCPTCSCGKPDPLGEALNSGDGTYRP